LFYESFRERAAIKQPYDFYCFTDCQQTMDELSNDPRYKSVTFLEAQTTHVPNYTKWDDDFYFGMSIKMFALKQLHLHYDRVLYMDVDIMVNREIDSLVNLDMQGKSCAGVRDFPYHRWTGPVSDDHVKHDVDDRVKLISTPRDYINSGVFLIDCTNIKYLMDYDDFSRSFKPRYVDQDYLNYMFDNDILIMDEKYNYMVDITFMAQKTYESRIIENLRMSKAHLQHFHGCAKPWKEPGSYGYKEVTAQANTTRFYHVFDRLKDELSRSSEYRWLWENVEKNRQAFTRMARMAEEFNKYSGYKHTSGL
jgi:lipopolysaccharide biosynthesis glycosyltransferase